MKILDAIKSIWYNLAFGPEFIEKLNEGTCVNNAVVTAILATFFDNPLENLLFLRRRLL